MRQLAGGTANKTRSDEKGEDMGPAHSLEDQSAGSFGQQGGQTKNE